MLGLGRGGTHPKINYKTLNETSNFRSQRFLDNKQGIPSHITDPHNIWSSDTKTYMHLIVTEINANYLQYVQRRLGRCDLSRSGLRHNDGSGLKLLTKLVGA